MQQLNQMSSLLRGENVAFWTTSLSAGHLSCASAASATYASHLPPSGHSKRQNVSFSIFIQFFYFALRLAQPRKSANFGFCKNITETFNNKSMGTWTKVKKKVRGLAQRTYLLICIIQNIKFFGIYMGYFSFCLCDSSLERIMLCRAVFETAVEA